jgi:hypothetical protein
MKKGMKDSFDKAPQAPPQKPREDFEALGFDSTRLGRDFDPRKSKASRARKEDPVLSDQNDYKHHSSSTTAFMSLVTKLAATVALLRSACRPALQLVVRVMVFTPSHAASSLNLFKAEPREGSGFRSFSSEVITDLWDYSLVVEEVTARAAGRARYVQPAGPADATAMSGRRRNGRSGRPGWAGRAHGIYDNQGVNAEQRPLKTMSYGLCDGLRQGGTGCAGRLDPQGWIALTELQKLPCYRNLGVTLEDIRETMRKRPRPVSS